MDNRSEDTLELGGRRIQRSTMQPVADRPEPPAGSRGKFLSIWFRCCHVYGRLYRNAMATAYEGRCPRCGAAVRAGIGPDGSPRRMFEAM